MQRFKKKKLSKAQLTQLKDWRRKKRDNIDDVFVQFNLRQAEHAKTDAQLLRLLFPPPLI